MPLSKTKIRACCRASMPLTRLLLLTVVLLATSPSLLKGGSYGFKTGMVDAMLLSPLRTTRSVAASSSVPYSSTARGHHGVPKLEEHDMKDLEQQDNINGRVGLDKYPTEAIVREPFKAPSFTPIDPIKEIRNVNQQYDLMKPVGISMFGDDTGKVFVGDIRVPRFSHSYHGTLGPLQPGDKGTRIRQLTGSQNSGPLSEATMRLQYPIDERPRTITPIVDEKLLSPNVRFRLLPGYLLSGMCADPKTGLPFPCSRLASQSVAMSPLEADRLGYDPFGVHKHNEGRAKDTDSFFGWLAGAISHPWNRL